MIEPQFTVARPFAEDLARVKIEGNGAILTKEVMWSSNLNLKKPVISQRDWRV